MPPFGRRPTDPVVDMSRSTASASPPGAFSFTTLDFSEILVPQDGSQIQLRHIDKGRRVLAPIDPNGESSFQTLRTTILEAFKMQAEPKGLSQNNRVEIVGRNRFADRISPAG